MKEPKRSAERAVKYALSVIIMAMLWTACISIVMAGQSKSKTSVSGPASTPIVFKNMSVPQK